MAKIKETIMIFVGTKEAAEFASALAEYTDNIYAAVSDEYGISPHPIGNLTLISKYLDEKNMKDWIGRIKADIVIDGTDIMAAAQREAIKKVCEERNIEYYHLAVKQQLNLHSTIYRNENQLQRDLEYVVGNVLAEGDTELFNILTGVSNFQEKIFIMLPADAEAIRKILNLGYKKDNIISK